jgi:hypothetical protein
MLVQKLILLALLLILPRSLMLQNVQGASGVRGVAIGNQTGATPPTSGLIYSPVAGHYTSAQSVGVTYNPSSSGIAVFYTLDGSAPSAASARFTSNLSISSNTTMNTLAEAIGSVRQETQATGSLWKICTPVGGGPGTPTSVKCGGVGSTQPSGWTVTYGATESISVSATSGAPQILITLGGSGCDSCTNITMDKWIQPLNNPNPNVENHEHDAWHNNGAGNRLHMGGLQCNQQTAFLQWQYDNEQGSWQNHVPAITQGCPLSTTLWTHIIWKLHWLGASDDGCGDGHSPSVHGGLGCTYYDSLSIGTATSPAVGATMTAYAINATLENDNPGWGGGCADQDQVDLRPGGTFPKTGGVKVQHNNVTCSTGTVATASAAYTIP